jgi:hypothetical protein
MTWIRLTVDNIRARQSDIYEVGPSVSELSSRLAATTAPSAAHIISSSKRSTPNQRRSFSGIRRLFSSSEKRRKHQAGYRPTYHKVVDGPACRIYGSVEVKKVTANLHITTLGHGYMSFEHTDHQRK